MDILLIFGNNGVLKDHSGGVSMGNYVGDSYGLHDLRVLNVFVVHCAEGRENVIVVVVVDVVVDGRHFEVVALMSIGVGSSQSLGYDVSVGRRSEAVRDGGKMRRKSSTWT